MAKADSILRLRVESKEYDDKLKRASEGIQHLAKAAHDCGAIITNLEKNEVEFIKNLGEFNTVATTSTGQVKELSDAFSNLAAVYNRLSDEEKNDEGGKALASSLQRLKERTLEAKSAVESAKDELSGSNGLTDALDSLSSKIGINIKGLSTWGVLLGASAASLKVMKDAVMASEVGVDEWGRAVEESKMTYEAFLNALNTGDISGYLGRIDQIVSAARDAYNALDELSTQKALDNPKLKAKQAEIDRFRAMLQTGRYIAPLDGQKAAMAEGTVLSKAQLERISKSLESALGEVGKMTKSRINTTTKAIEALYEEQASVLGISKKAFMENTSSMDAFKKALDQSDKYWEWRMQNTTTEIRGTGMNVRTVQRYDDSKNPYRDYAWARIFRDDGELFARINSLINERQGAQSQYYGMAAQNYRGINRAQGVSPYGGAGSRTAPSAAVAAFVPAEGSLQYLQNQLKAAQALQSISPNIAEFDSWAIIIGELTRQIQVFKGEYQETFAPEGPAAGSIDYQILKVKELTDAWRSATNDTSRIVYAEQLKEQQAILDQMQGKTTTATATQEGKKNSVTGLMQQTVSGINNVVNGIETLGAEIPAGLKSVVNGIQAVATILSGISALVTIITAVQGTKAIPVIGWALSTGGTNKNGRVVRAASGYTVPGNFGYDAVPALLTSGETVLNRSQTNNLASQLNGGALGNLKLSAVIEGTQIRMVLNNTTKQMGKGTYVTSR